MNVLVTAHYVNYFLYSLHDIVKPLSPTIPTNVQHNGGKELSFVITKCPGFLATVYFFKTHKKFTYFLESQRRNAAKRMRGGSSSAASTGSVSFLISTHNCL